MNKGWRAAMALVGLVPMVTNACAQSVRVNVGIANLGLADEKKNRRD